MKSNKLIIISEKEKTNNTNLIICFAFFKNLKKLLNSSLFADFFIIKRTKKRRILEFVIVIFLLFLVSCASNVDQITGNIVGNVITYDQYGNMLSDELTKVTINSTEFSTNTDNAGYYEIKNIPVGTYTIKYDSKKTGNHIKHGVQIVGGDNAVHIDDVVLVEKSTTTIGSIYIGYHKIEGKLTVDENHEKLQKVILFASIDNRVSKNNYEYSQIAYANEDGFFEFSIIDSYYTNSDYDIYVVVHTLSYPEHSLNCDEYNFCHDQCISETPSIVIKIEVPK